MRCLHPTEKAHFYVRTHERGEAQASHRRWHIVDMQAKGEAEAQLGDSGTKEVSLGSVVARIIGRNMPPLTYTMRHFFASGAVFFRRSRLFFREAAFSSGGEGCEWRAPRATVGESGDKAENEFSGFIPLAVPRKGFSPHIPASRLFSSFHATKGKQQTYSSQKPHQIPTPQKQLSL